MMLKVAGLLALIAMMLGTNACGRSNDAHTAVGREIHLLDSSVSLPLDATSVHLAEEGALDAYQAVRFDTSLKNAHTFAIDLTGSEPRLGRWSFNSDFDADWWVSDFKKAEGSTTKTSKGDRITVVINSAPGGRARVWVEIFQT